MGCEGPVLCAVFGLFSTGQEPVQNQSRCRLSTGSLCLPCRSITSRCSKLLLFGHQLDAGPELSTSLEPLTPGGGGRSTAERYFINFLDSVDVKKTKQRWSMERTGPAMLIPVSSVSRHHVDVAHILILNTVRRCLEIPYQTAADGGDTF